MPTTPNLGIQYPDGSATPSRKNWVEDPIESVDAQVVAYLRKHFKCGTAHGSIPVGAQYADVSVVFGTPFEATPVVTGAVRTVTGVLYGAIIQSVTPAGFVVRLMRPTGAAPTVAAGLSYGWHASDLGNQ